MRLCTVLAHRDPEGAVMLQECRNPCCTVQGKTCKSAGRSCPLSCERCVSPTILVAASCCVKDPEDPKEVSKVETD
eukprot:1879885-Rhodomonas_salina.1